MLDWLEEMLAAPCWAGPCFNCQAGKTQHRSQTLRTLRSPGHEVHLAVSPLGGLRGLGGYHTSVLIAGEEYYFSPSGLHCCSKMYSHPEEVVVRTFVGLSAASGAELLSFLGEHFREGSYDLLRKNCNAFTDCALYFLCEQRLDLRYRAMEQLAWMANDRTGILQSLTNGEYSPNPLAQDFELEAILQDIDQARAWESGSDCSEDVTIEVLPESAYVACREMSLQMQRPPSHPSIPLERRPSSLPMGSGEQIIVQRL